MQMNKVRLGKSSALLRITRKKATKRNVATILGMEGRVTHPRSIAYAAVLVSLLPFLEISILSLLLCIAGV